MSKEELLERTGKMVAEERKITAQLLECLREVERRRLHFELGYASMFKYLTEGHGYSAGAAGRRISAMRLSRDVPEVTAAIENGEISLNVASQVGYFLQNERKAGKSYTPEQKSELT